MKRFLQGAALLLCPVIFFAACSGPSSGTHSTRSQPPAQSTSRSGTERVVSHAGDTNPRHPRLFDTNAPNHRSATAPAVSSPQPTSTSPAPRPTSSGRTHTVIQGDTLWRVSQQYGVTVDALRQANGLTGDVIQPGQVLRIP